MSHDFNVRHLPHFSVCTAVHSWTKIPGRSHFDRRYWVILFRTSKGFFGIRWPHDDWPWTVDFWIKTRYFWALAIIFSIVSLFA